MAEHPGERDVPLARGGELRPVGRDRRCEIEHATFDQPQNTGRRQPLRRGEDQRGSVAGPRTAALAIGQARPQIDDRPATVVDAARRPDLAVSREVGREGLAHAGEARRCLAMNLDRHGRVS